MIALDQAWGDLPDTSSVGNGIPFGFSAKYTDAESGLIYYGYRYYQPSAGRWLSRDPIEERGGKGLYSFVVNNPVTAIDAFGLKKWKGCACVSRLEIVKVEKYTAEAGEQYGHKFAVIVDLKYVRDGEGDAQLMWEEKTDRPPAWQKLKPNEWNDIYARFPDSPVFSGWNERQKPCPGAEMVAIVDIPATWTILPARTLEFKITVKSGEKCPCPIKSLTVTAKQVLEPTTDNPPGIKTQEFTTP